MRNLGKGRYQTTVVGEEFIILVGGGNIKHGQSAVKNSSKVAFTRSIDLANVIWDNFGVDTYYNDPETFTAENILKLSPDTLLAVVTSAAAMKKNKSKGFPSKKIVK
ncbi:MAG: hypothetical protein Q9172_001696 [Xanthocarpia lactea]